MALKGKLIYDGDGYALFQRFRLALRAPLLCPFIVVLKTTEAARLATFREKAFFIAAVGELAKLGHRPGSDEFESLCEYFCEAVFSRGNLLHRIFFGQTPQEAAMECV